MLMFTIGLGIFIIGAVAGALIASAIQSPYQPSDCSTGLLGDSEDAERRSRRVQ